MNLQKIESFQIDHTLLEAGIYVSRRDKRLMTTVTTFDLRFVAPGKQPPVDVPALHTIEHLGATFLRNSRMASDVVYFGPMGCRTGFYLVMFGRLEPKDIYPLILEMCDFICAFEGEIPGATARECGNYREHNLDTAKYYVDRYREELAWKRFDYPVSVSPED